MLTGWRDKKILMVFAVILVVCLSGAWFLIGQQQTLEKLPPRRGTIRAMLEDPDVKGDISLFLLIENPTFRSIDELANKSEVVAVGTVLKEYSYPCRDMRFVCTDSVFKVRHALAGVIPEMHRAANFGKPVGAGNVSRSPLDMHNPDEVIVSRLGGQVKMQGRIIRGSVNDEIPLIPGKDYVLFLAWLNTTTGNAWGKNTYVCTSGSQAAIEIQGETLRSLIPNNRPLHPIKIEIEKTLKGNLRLLSSHFDQRRPGPRP